MDSTKNLKHERVAQLRADVERGTESYVYLLVDPRTERPFFIGKRYRLFRRARGVAKGRSSGLKADQNGEITALCLSIQHVVLKELEDECMADESEREYIAQFEMVGDLANQAKGGAGLHDPSWRPLRAVFVVTVRQCARIKPFEQWVAERPRTAAQVQMYRDVSQACFRLARRLQSAYLAARVS